MANGDPLLSVEGLRTQFRTERGLITAVEDVGFAVRRGRTLCIVGESGSGKTATALSIMRLIEPPGRITAGRITFDGRDLMTLDERAMEGVRGSRIAMIFQDPMTSLNPSFTIGRQIAEGLMVHRGLGRAEAERRAVEVMGRVGIPDAAQRLHDYPHQFSGGMRQRVLIAGAIACDPELLIADEPTTALDVTIQAQILKLLRDIQRRLSSALILVTHDLGVVATMADEVMVMYAGRVVEHADVRTIFAQPRHPYTKGLLGSLVSIDSARGAAFRPIPGLPPDLARLPAGCAFAPRCPEALDRCQIAVPPLDSMDNRRIACWRAAGDGAAA
jgi:oligopeptide transport system ATP-binding protein